MERLLFQKNINLEYPLQELVSINVKECLNYSTDDKGKRAVGTLNVEGDYLYKKQKYHFEDMIEIDILAPFERLSETEDFYVEIDDYEVYPFYICKKEDDYQSIAEKLKVEEEMLRALNDNREIDESCIIRLKKQ